MGRILALDYGSKRTGIAATDPLQMIATGLDTIPTHTLESWLTRYKASEQVDLVVIGCPLMLDGSESETITRHITPFINRLKKVFPDLPVHLLDERFTSKIALRAMVDGGMKKSDRMKKENIDKVSATILLQDYLESMRNK